MRWPCVPGAMATPTRPHSPAGRPCPVSCCPSFAGIFGSEKAAARTGERRIHAPGRPMRLPHGGEQNLRLIRGHGEIGGADFRSAIQNFSPGVAAIGRAENAAFVIWAVGVAESGDEHGIRVFRIDDDPADLTRVLQADVGPGLAAIGGFVNAVAAREIRANIRFARAGVENVWVRWRDFERSDGCDGLAVENGSPDGAGIVGFPDAAIHAAEIEGRAAARDTTHRNRPAAAEGPDGSPFKAAEKARRNLLSCCGRTEERHTKPQKGRAHEFKQYPSPCLQ